ncbi:O-antigen ligase family protein [Pseudomonas sp. NP21570]|nr:O-antigen ligase family protein [Pseudomonas sp. NP21570]
MLYTVSRFLKERLFLIALLPVAVVLLGRFWWPGETSAWASSIRFALLTFLVCLVFVGRPVFARLDKKLGAVLLLFGGWVILSVALFDGQSEVLRRGLVLVVFICAVAVLKMDGEAALLNLLRAAALVGTAAALVTIYFELERRGLDFRYRAFRLHSSGVPGFAEFFNPIISGMHMAFAGLTACWCVLFARTPAARIFWFLCLSVIAIYVFLTYSRSAWLALGLGGLVLLILRGRAIFWGIFVGAMILALVVITIKFPQVFSVEVERGTTNRDLIWAMVIDSMPGYWLAGHGAGIEMSQMSIPGQTVVNTHSLYLEVLFQYGVVGLLLFLAALLMATRAMWTERSDLSVLGVSLLAGSIGVMFFELHSFIHSPNLIWLWIWFPMAIALGSQFKRNAQ